MLATDRVLHPLFPVAIPAGVGEALRSWVVREKAVHTIEIGLGYGMSALYTYEGLLTSGDSDARHVAMDPHQDWRFSSLGLKFIEEVGLSPVLEFHPEGSEFVLPRFISEGRSFDFAFVDGNHRFDSVFVDLFYLGRLVKPGGIIFLDDYQLPGIARAVAFFLTNLGWTLEDQGRADDLHSWAVLRTPTDADTRTFEYFVDF